MSKIIFHLYIYHTSTHHVHCWLSDRKKFKGGGRNNRPLLFQNNRLLFILFFLLFSKILGGQKSFWGTPPVAGSQIESENIAFNMKMRFYSSKRG